MNKLKRNTFTTSRANALGHSLSEYHYRSLQVALPGIQTCTPAARGPGDTQYVVYGSVFFSTLQPMSSTA